MGSTDKVNWHPVPTCVRTLRTGRERDVWICYRGADRCGVDHRSYASAERHSARLTGKRALNAEAERHG